MRFVALVGLGVAVSVLVPAVGLVVSVGLAGWVFVTRRSVL